MDEKLPQEDILETEQHLEEQAPIEHVETSNMGNIPVLFSSLAKSVFGSADYLENDRKYKKIVQQNYEVWAKDNPGKFSGKLFVRTKSGNLIINPELGKHLPNLEERSKAQFERLNPKRAELYRKLEGKRAYLDINDDPAFRKLNKDITSSTKRQLGTLPIFNNPEDITKRLTDSNKIRDDHYRAFVESHPEKARYYAHTDPKIKAAFEEHKQEEWAKKSANQRRLTRLKNPHLVPEVERKSWMPKRMRRVSDWYDRKKEELKKWFHQSKAGRLLGWNKLQQNRLTQWYTRKKEALKQRLLNTRIGRVYQKYTSFKDYLANKWEDTKDRVKNYLKKRLVPARLQRFSPKNIGSRLFKKALSALAKRLPGLAGYISKSLLGAKKILGNLFRKGAQESMKMALSLVKNGAKALGQFAARAGVAILAAASPELIVIGAVVIVVVLIVLFLLFGGEDITQKEDQLAQVSITKIGDEKVDKGGAITYKVTTSLQGSAQDIIITDPLPEGTECVSATGRYTFANNTITWKMSENIGIADQPLPTTAPCQLATQTTAPSGPPTSEEPKTGQKIDITKYTQAPFYLPTPNGSSDWPYNDQALAFYNELGGSVANHLSYLQSSYPAPLVDPFLSVIWVGAIEGINKPYYWNCHDGEEGTTKGYGALAINTGCRGWYTSGLWQVGYGIQVAQVGPILADAFKEAYGTSDANKVQEVGQKIMQTAGITNPATFPNLSIDQIVAQAGNPGTSRSYRNTSDDEALAQQAIAILLLDNELGAILISKEVAEDIGSMNGNWADTMKGWDGTDANGNRLCGYYCNNLQNFSNRTKTLAEQYTGVGGGSGSSFASQTFSLTLKSTIDQGYVLNKATANIIGGSSGASGSSNGTVPAGGNEVPNAETCGGKYSLSNPISKNFGDPSCNFTKDALYAQLKAEDQANADDWFYKVIPCESAYDPNTYYRTGAAGDTPDINGAWGLYQTGSSNNGPGTDGVGLNGAFDRGDVPWQKQTSNAIGLLGTNGWAYWACRP